jgi:hypothetical protein
MQDVPRGIVDIENSDAVGFVGEGTPVYISYVCTVCLQGSIAGTKKPLEDKFLVPGSTCRTVGRVIFQMTQWVDGRTQNARDRACGRARTEKCRSAEAQRLSLWVSWCACPTDHRPQTLTPPSQSDHRQCTNTPPRRRIHTSRHLTATSATYGIRILL